MFCYNNDSYVISIIHWRLKSTAGILASRIGLPCPENFGIFCHENYTFRCIQKHFLSRVSTAMLTLNIDVGILSVCLPRPSVRSSRSDIVSKRLNILSYFLQRMVDISDDLE